MHIAYIVNQFPPYVTSGLGRYVEAVSPRLVKLGCRLSVFSLNPGDLPKETLSAGIKVTRPTSRLQRFIFGRKRFKRTGLFGFAFLTLNALVSNFVHAFKLAVLHRKDPIDIIVVHDTTNALAGVIASWVVDVPIVLHVMTVEYTMETEGTVYDRLRLFSALERLFVRRCSHIILPSKELKYRVSQQGWPSDRLEVIELGNPFEDLPKDVFDGFERSIQTRQLLGIPRGAPLIVFAGRIEPAKGVFELAEAFGIIAERNTKVYLAIIGEGDIETVAKIVSKSGAGDRARLIDSFMDESVLRDVYTEADVCIFPSKFEPFGLVAIEAMSLGKPVVLGDGFCEAICGSKYSDDPVAVITCVTAEAIANSVLGLLDDDRRRSRIGLAAKQHASYFTWDNTANRLFHRYSSLVREN